MEKLTVFTATYNRAYCLPQLYQSLQKQTSKDFIWLVIDDGSEDNTKSLVESWIAEKDLSIVYIYQENKGMLGAHNKGYENIDTPLSVCIDSDDFMPDDGVEKIINLWDSHGSNAYAGMVGLDIFKNGDVIGTKFPNNLKKATFQELIDIHKVKGDKKYVYRTEVIRKYLPYPFFEGEKFPAQDYVYRQIDQDYKLLVFNEVFCVVEYLPDGNSNNKITSYLKNPNSFAFYRLDRMKKAHSFSLRFKQAVHFVSSSIIANNKNFFGATEHKYTTMMALPFGYLLSLYLKNTKKKAGFNVPNKKV
ncbi:glycosyltransferase family A protein [Zunongwangia sp. F363]|uniref:Glycosyltransferase family A protein n=1 Tax=Autumnicola tepida TaxID=3075595 RepID=A0ABU3C7G0_9FLAO|nr:glycosyltransferase family A protein [Zunongwangia sp. F363]MDT0642285.1 glycosyltransferase family A protein [Zunongwangia sp. F363]